MSEPICEAFSICGIIVPTDKNQQMISATTINRFRGRSYLYVAASFASLFLAAPLSGFAAGPGTTYKDPEFGYSLTAPNGWTRKPDFPRPYVAFLGPVEDGFQTNFHVDPEPAGNRTLAQFVKVARETAAKNKSIRLRSKKARSSTILNCGQWGA